MFGQGSTFYAVLPRQAPKADPLDHGVATPRKPGQLDILVVEDDSKDRAWVVETLTAAGYGVEIAVNGEQAMKAVRRTRFDAITLDLLLPDMSGWDVLRTIRSSQPNHDVPAIVLTVLSDAGSGLGFVIQDFLAKPVKEPELLRALSRVSLDGESSLLVIDDDPTTAKLVRVALQYRAMTVRTAIDGATGLREAALAPPSVIILDLLMPGMDGFEFLYQFRLTETGRRTPVIVWTDKDLTHAERARLQASAQAMVLKGAGSGETLIRELELHIARSKRSRLAQ